MSSASPTEPVIPYAREKSSGRYAAACATSVDPPTAPLPPTLPPDRPVGPPQGSRDPHTRPGETRVTRPAVTGRRAALSQRGDGRERCGRHPGTPEKGEPS
ncbi:hypothetical protein GCM10010222_22640 [Streptomyces tanashiensis]|nr:hypothetical protein GCM10010222_22640 [Streptomyces tanashiensis]